MKRAVILSLLSICFCCARCTMAHPVDTELERCERDGGDIWEIVECVDSVREKWKERLQQSYDELMDMLPKDGQLLLRNALDAWEEWTEAESKLLSAIHMAIYDNLDGGKVWLVRGAAARMNVVRERALEMAAYVDERRGGEALACGTAVAEPFDESLIGKRHDMISSALGAKDRGLSSRDLHLWQKYREEEVAFLAWFRGKTGDPEFFLNARSVKDAARLDALDGLVKDLQGAFLLPGTINRFRM